MGPLVVSTLRLCGLYATLYVRSDCACRNSFVRSLCCSSIDDRHRCRHLRKISSRVERRPLGLVFANVARCAASKAVTSRECRDNLQARRRGECLARQRQIASQDGRTNSPRPLRRESSTHNGWARSEEHTSEL